MRRQLTIILVITQSFLMWPLGWEIPTGVADELPMLPLLITEVLPDPALSPENLYEWFEIHNTSDQELVIPELTVADALQNDVLKNIVIPALGYHLVAGSALALPGVPTDTISLVADGKIGNGLANTSDRVALIDQAGRTIDSVDWGGLTAPGSLRIPAPREGRSLHRSPADRDTNTASDFIELTEPTPGAAYVPPAPALPGTTAQPGAVRISEVLADPSQSPENDFEWLELFNPGNGPVTLRQWSIADNSSQVALPEINLSANSYVILAPTDQALAAFAPVPSPVVILNRSIGNGLANSGDKLVLKDSTGTVIDQLSWGTNTDSMIPSIPAAAEGFSIQLCRFTSVETLAADFDNGVPTPGQACMLPVEPEPPAPPPADPPVSSPLLPPGEPLPVSSPLQSPNEPEPDITPPAPVAYSNAVIINEFLPAPSNVVDWDLNGAADSQDEWIELMNTGGNPVDLQGWYLDDGEGGSAPHRIADQTSIDPEGFLTYFKQDRPSRAGTHLILNNDADCVRLISPDLVVRDSYCYEATTTDASYARGTDRSWTVTISPTPSVPNVITAKQPVITPAPLPASPPPAPPVPVEYPDVLINEILPAPARVDWDGNGLTNSYDEWIEILNPGPELVDLTAWTLQTGTASTVHSSALPTGTNIPVSGSLVLYRLDTPTVRGTHLILNNESDCVRLLTPAGEEKDRVCYADIPADQSYARLPNASSVWSITELPTPGSANQIVLAAADATETMTIPLMSIDEVKGLPLGSTIHTTGLVTALPGRVGINRIYIQDDGGTGIAVELKGSAYPDLHLGDRVEVSSTIESKYGELFIRTDEINILEPEAVPAALRLRTGTIDEDVLGILVRVTGTISAQSGSVFTIDDGTGQINIAIKTTTGIKKPRMRKGDIVTVTGIVSRYKTSSTKGEGFRILPRFQSDIRYSLATTGPTVDEALQPFLLVLFALVSMKTIINRYIRTSTMR